MLEAGDLDGYDVWRRILRAVEELPRVEPGPGVEAVAHGGDGFQGLYQALWTAHSSFCSSAAI